MALIDADRVIQYFEQRDKLLLAEIGELRKQLATLADVDGNQKLSVEEAAKLAGRSVNTIKNWCYDGSLDYEQPTPKGKITIVKRKLMERIKRYS